MTILEIPVFDIRELEKNKTVISSSKGNQPKWKVDNLWLKQDYFGYESVAEVLASNILESSRLPSDYYVTYRPCTITTHTGQQTGCYSQDFRGTLTEKPLGRLLEEHLIDINSAMSKRTTEEALSILVTTIEKLTRIPYTVVDTHLRLLFAFDALTFNEDRHLNNILFLTDGFQYRFAPIFDNGLAFLSDVKTYRNGVNLTALERSAKPVLLTKSFDKHVTLYKGDPFINRPVLKELLTTHQEYYGRAGNLLYRRLTNKKYDHLFYD